MDFLKELFGSGEDLLKLTGALQQPMDREKLILGGDARVRQEGIQPNPLPLLPADMPIHHLPKPTNCSSSSAVPVPLTEHEHSNHNRDHDIREVPSEMPMYLLAEDEGNEEEIMRLLESESPGGSDSPFLITDFSHSEDVQCRSDEPPMYAARHASPLDLVSQEQHTTAVYGEVKARSERVTSKEKEKRHGGGWPKGKSRRSCNERQLPKPPATGYSLYISENKVVAEEECGTKSMSVLSRKLGTMWSELTAGQKNVYNCRAKTDRLRYLEELKNYLACIYEGVNLEKALKVVSQSSSVEKDDNVLMCCVCQLTFTSLYNKQSHYSGKLHLQTLLQNIDSLMRQATPMEHCIQDSEEHSKSIVSSLEKVAANYHNGSGERVYLRSKIRRALDINATLQQQYGEAEYFRLKYSEHLRSLQTKEKLIKKTMQAILQILHNYSTCTCSSVAMR